MILAILQARVSSRRLPGKVLKPLLGMPMLYRQIERVQRAGSIDRVVVATSVDPSDDPIEALCAAHGVFCYRGSLTDVLDRFYRAAQAFQPEHIIRLTGDCPLSDPQLIDELVRFYLSGAFDYASNALEPTFPDGLDAEIFRAECLQAAWEEASLPSQREHVTPFIYQSRDRFKLGAYKNNVDLSDFRWTVDEAEDFELISKIYEALHRENPAFTWQDVLSFVEKNQDLKLVNRHIGRNEGYLDSLSQDADLLKKI